MEFVLLKSKDVLHSFDGSGKIAKLAQAPVGRKVMRLVESFPKLTAAEQATDAAETR